MLRPDQTPGDGLDVREHPELGPTLYRDRDIWPPLRVESVEKMFSLLDEGTSNMTKAATLLNKGAQSCFVSVYACAFVHYVFFGDLADFSLVV